MANEHAEPDQDQDQDHASTGQDKDKPAGDDTNAQTTPDEKASQPNPANQPAPEGNSSGGSGCFKIGCGSLAVLLVLTVGFLYWVAAGLDPSLGPGNPGAKNVAKAAVKHLSKNPHVHSARTTSAGADSSAGAFAQVEAHLKDDTTVDDVAEILPSTCCAAQRHSIWGRVTVEITFTGNLQGTDISTSFSCSGSGTPLSASVRRDLTPVGQATTITREGNTSPLQVNYGEVTTFPSSLTATSGSKTEKAFTMNGWQIKTTSNEDGQFANAPLDQVVDAAR